VSKKAKETDAEDEDDDDEEETDDENEQDCEEEPDSKQKPKRSSESGKQTRKSNDDEGIPAWAQQLNDKVESLSGSVALLSAPKKKKKRAPALEVTHQETQTQTRKHPPGTRIIKLW